MGLICFVLLISACVPQFDLGSENKFGHPSIVISADGLGAFDPQGIAKEPAELFVEIKDQRINKQDLKKHIFLTPKPTKEVLLTKEQAASWPVFFTRTDWPGVFKLALKKPLPLGQIYGVFVKDLGAENAILSLVTYMPHAKSVIIAHDLGGIKAPFRISQGRLHFTFIFSHQVRLLKDQAVVLNSKEQGVIPPVIESLSLESNGKILRVRLKKENGLILGKKYSFDFPGIGSLGSQGIDLKPIQIVIVSGSLIEEKDEPWAITSTSDNSIEIKYFYSSFHSADLFLLKRSVEESLISDHDKKSIVFYDKKFLVKGNQTFYVTGLKSDTEYKFIILVNDESGFLRMVQGNFSTEKPFPLRFKKFLFNPIVPEGQLERQAEYIELINAGKNPLSLEDVYLKIETTDGKRSKDCALVSADQVSMVYPNESALLVSKEFLAQNHSPLGKPPLIIRVSGRTLCGGLPNKKSVVVKLHKGDGHLIDRYGGYLLPTPEGQSVLRIDPMGLDVASNYCYSNEANSCVSTKPKR